MVELSPQELERYDRQLRIWGIQAQLKLKSSKVLIAGLGGLGCPAALYLAAAGVGELILVDKDKVELSNLNRQILHWSSDLGIFKAISGANKLSQLNPEIKLRPMVMEIARDNVNELVAQVDLVIDGQDNFPTRFLLNEACVVHGIPFIHAAIYGMESRLMVIVPGKTPCLRCLIPVDPPQQETFPAAGIAPGIAGVLQALEAIKILTGIGKPYLGKLLVLDGEQLSFSEFQVMRNPECQVCGRYFHED